MQILRARKNLELPVSQRQEEILIGCILGDAHITKRGQIRIEQGEKQKDYLAWKYNELQSLAYQNIYQAQRRDKRNGKSYKSFYITLRQYFRPWRNIWYPNGKKIFSQRPSITNLSLAVWYMDDGSWNKTRNAIILSIDGFDRNDRNKIQEFFKDELGIETLIRSNKQLRIRSNSHDRFFEKIRPYIIPSMEYKISNPVTTES